MEAPTGPLAPAWVQSPAAADRAWGKAPLSPSQAAGERPAPGCVCMCMGGVEGGAWGTRPFARGNTRAAIRAEAEPCLPSPKPTPNSAPRGWHPRHPRGGVGWGGQIVGISPWC